MQNWRAILMIFLSLNFGKNAYAMDLAPRESRFLTVGQARVLLANGFEDEVAHYAGCCRDNAGCSSSVGCLYLVFGILGFCTLLVAGGTTGGAFPDPGVRRPNFNPQIFDIGMSFWGAFFFTVIAPPVIIPSTNALRNYCIRTRNERICKLIRRLDHILGENTRLEEQHVYALDFLLIQADENTLQSLDGDQALTLSLRNLPRFRELVDSNAFAGDGIFWAIKLIQLLDMSEADRRKFFSYPENLDLLRKHKELFYALEKHLWFYETLPSQLLPGLHEQWTESYTGDGYAQVDQSPELLIPLEPSDNSDLTLIVENESIKANKEALKSLSKTVADMLEDVGRDNDSLPVPEQYKVADIQTLVMLSNLSEPDRKKFKIRGEDLEEYLALDKIFHIEFLYKKCEEFCLVNGVPGDWAAQLAFVYKHELVEVKSRVIVHLLNKLNSLKFEDADFKGIDALSSADRTVLLANFKWDTLFTRFVVEPTFLALCWKLADGMKNKEFLLRLRDYCNQTGNRKVVARAWIGIPPAEVAIR